MDDAVRALRHVLELAQTGDLEASATELAFLGGIVSARAKRWNLVALDLGVDLSTPSGEFMANVLASAAQWERRVIGAAPRTRSRSRRPTAPDSAGRRRSPQWSLAGSSWKGNMASPLLRSLNG